MINSRSQPLGSHLENLAQYLGDKSHMSQSAQNELLKRVIATNMQQIFNFKDCSAPILRQLTEQAKLEVYQVGQTVPANQDVDSFEMLIVFKGSIAMHLKNRNQNDHQPVNKKQIHESASVDSFSQPSSVQHLMQRGMSNSMFGQMSAQSLPPGVDAVHLVKEHQYVDSQLFRRTKPYKWIPMNSRTLIQQVIRVATSRINSSDEEDARAKDANPLNGRILDVIKARSNDTVLLRVPIFLYTGVLQKYLNNELEFLRAENFHSWMVKVLPGLYTLPFKKLKAFGIHSSLVQLRMNEEYKYNTKEREGYVTFFLRGSLKIYQKEVADQDYHPAFERSAEQRTQEKALQKRLGVEIATHECRQDAPFLTGDEPYWLGITQPYSVVANSNDVLGLQFPYKVFFDAVKQFPTTILNTMMDEVSKRCSNVRKMYEMHQNCKELADQTHKPPINVAQRLKEERIPQSQRYAQLKTKQGFSTIHRKHLNEIQEPHQYKFGISPSPLLGFVETNDHQVLKQLHRTIGPLDFKNAAVIQRQKIQQCQADYYKNIKAQREERERQTKSQMSFTATLGLAARSGQNLSPIQRSQKFEPQVKQSLEVLDHYSKGSAERLSVKSKGFNSSSLQRIPINTTILENSVLTQDSSNEKLTSLQQPTVNDYSTMPTIGKSKEQKISIMNAHQTSVDNKFTAHGSIASTETKAMATLFNSFNPYQSQSKFGNSSSSMLKGLSAKGNPGFRSIYHNPDHDKRIPFAAGNCFNQTIRSKSMSTEPFSPNETMQYSNFKK